MSPEQKARIVHLLRHRGRTVGFLRDGVNDALALHEADVGLSVDTAVDVAKDAADIILMGKDLGVLADGIAEGRRIFANTVKYVLPLPRTVACSGAPRGSASMARSSAECGVEAQWRAAQRSRRYPRT